LTHGEEKMLIEYKNHDETFIADLVIEEFDESFSHEFGTEEIKGIELLGYVVHKNKTGRSDDDMICRLDLQKIYRGEISEIASSCHF